MNKESLLNVASERQKEILEVYWKHKSYKKAAKILGVSEGTISKAIKRVKKKAEKAGLKNINIYGIDVENTPEQALSGVSTLYDKDGNIALQWVKTKTDGEVNLKEKIDIMVDSIIDDVKGKSDIINTPDTYIKDEMVVIPVGDLHIGMYSWEDETGESYDCDIAEQLVVSAFDKIIDEMPPREKALIVSLGDWFHSDTVQNKTLMSGNILDVDTRWQKVFRVGVKIMKYVINKSAEKFKKIDVIIVNGNHDYHTSYALSLVMDAYYHNNDNIHIDNSVNPFKYYKYGCNLIGLTHGTIKEASLPGIMAADMPKEWGECNFRMWFIGHKHRHKLMEYPGCVVECFPTLAAKDAWTHTSGYRSQREISAIILHKDYGEIGRNTLNVKMIKTGKNY